MTRRLSTETWRLSGDQDQMQVWRSTAGLGREMRLRPGTVLYRQGECIKSFYLIVSGKIEVSMLREDGSSFMVEIMGSGAVCGEAAAFDGVPCFSTACAEEPSVVMRYETDQLDEAFRANPELAMALMRVFAAKQRIMSRRAQSLSAPAPEVRIGELLARLGSTYGTIDLKDGLAIPFALTHEQIATMTGTSRVTVTRSLKRLRGIGALSVSKNRICIKDLKLLAS